MSQTTNEATLMSVPAARPLDLGWRWSAMVMGVVVAAFLPLVYWHVTFLWTRDQYQYIPLLPLGAAMLIWQRWDEIGSVKAGSRVVFLTVVVLVLAAAALAVAIPSPWLGAVAFLMMLGAGIYGYGGRHLFRALLPAWLLLWLAIPLPLNLDGRLVLWLQGLTAHWASRLLNWIGILHVASGNVLDIPGHRLFVEEACAGIHSLFACLSVTIFYVLWSRHHWFRGLLLLGGAVFWVLAANAIRVVLITLAVRRGFESVAQADTWQHEAVGILVFIFALAMIVSTDRLLMFFLPFGLNREPRFHRQEEGVRGRHRWPSLNATWLGSWMSVPIAAAFGLLVLTQGVLLMGGSVDIQEEYERVARQFENIEPALIPNTWGSPREGAWQFVRFDKQQRIKTDAKYSRFWEYKRGNMTAYVSLDFPFYGWHDLVDCYNAAGWQDGERITHDAADNPQGMPYVELNLSQSSIRQGYLLFSLFTKYGVPMPNRYDVFSKALGKITSVRENWRTFRSGEDRGSGETAGFQIQLFIDTYTPLTPEQKDEARAFFLEAAEKFRELAPETVLPSAQ